MKNDLIKKGLVCAVLILFVGMSIIPLVGSLSVERASTKEQIYKSNLADDTTPPVTTISFDPPGGYWHTSDVTMTLEATDDMSGVNTTYYSINSEPWKAYDESILLHQDGVYHIVYFSVDNAGNMEFPKLSRLGIDQTPPDTYLDWKVYNEGGKWYVKFILIATDKLSGMSNRVEFYLNDVLQYVIEGPGPVYDYVIQWENGLKFATFGFGVWDNAGNHVIVSVNGSDIKSSPSDQSSQQYMSPLFLQTIQRLLNIR